MRTVLPRADAWQLRRAYAGRMRGQRVATCGGNGRSHAGALRGYCPDYSVSGQQAGPSGARRTAKPVPWGMLWERLPCPRMILKVSVLRQNLRFEASGVQQIEQRLRSAR